MITQPGWRKGNVLKKFVIQAHPIIQTYLEKLKIAELIATYIKQDQRLKLPVEQTLCVLLNVGGDEFCDLLLVWAKWWRRLRHVSTC